MPAHVTAVYPFLTESKLTESVTARLAELCAELPALDVTFASLGRFPGVLYLAPQPAEGLRAVTASIAAEWPETPPYGGRFDHVVPHLTIAQGVCDDVMNDVERDVSGRLPVRARLREARLYVFDGMRWQSRARLPFQAP